MKYLPKNNRITVKTCFIITLFLFRPFQHCTRHDLQLLLMHWTTSVFLQLFFFFLSCWQVLQSRNILRGNKLLGSFKLDIATVWAQPGMGKSKYTKTCSVCPCVRCAHCLRLYIKCKVAPKTSYARNIIRPGKGYKNLGKS